MGVGNDMFKDHLKKQFIESIESVEISEGVIKDDPKYWTFKFRNIADPIKIDAELLDNPTAFRKKYLKLTNKPAPPLDIGSWYDVLDMLSETATYTTYEEESDEVYLAKTIMAEIQSLGVINVEDPKLKKDPSRIYKTRGYISKKYGSYNCKCIHHSIIKNIVEEAGFKFTPRIVSGSLTQLGYKLPSSKSITIHGLDVRVWAFVQQDTTNQEGA